MAISTPPRRYLGENEQTRLVIPAAYWDQIGDSLDAPLDGVLLAGPLYINGIPHHVNAIRVIDHTNDGDAYVQRAYYDECQDELDNWYRVYEDAAWAPIKIAGLPGEYVVLIHPYDD